MGLSYMQLMARSQKIKSNHMARLVLGTTIYKLVLSKASGTCFFRHYYRMYYI